MTRTVILGLLSLALLGLPGTALAEDDPSLSADAGATVNVDPGEADLAPFGVTPEMPETPPSDGSDDEDRDDENATADEHRKDGEHRRDGNASGEDPDEDTSDDSRDGDEDRPSVPEEPSPPEPPERDAIVSDSSDNETQENETEDDEEEPVLDPMAPTHFSTRARGPGPIDDARVGATVYHNTTKAGVSLHEALVLEPTTRVDAVDEAARDATEATPVHDLLWGWRFTHDDEGGVILDLG